MEIRSFGDNLREARARMGLTQEALARRLGLKNTNTVSQWERSPDPPRSPTIVKLATALQTTPVDLLQGVVHPLVRQALGQPVPPQPAVTDEMWMEFGHALEDFGARTLVYRSVITTITLAQEAKRRPRK